MVSIIFHALGGIFSIVFIIGLGYILTKRGWFDEKSSKVLAHLVTGISLPLYMITNMTSNFTRDTLLAMAPELALPFLSIVLAYCIGRTTARFIHVKEGRRGVFTTNFFIANTMFIGLPVNLALFGDKSVPAVMLYYIVNTLMFWTLGVQNILKDTEEGLREAEQGTHTLAGALKKLCSPPLLGFATGILLVLLGVPLPKFLAAAFKYVGNMTTPLSLIFIGIEISHISLHTVQFDKDLCWSLLGRFCVCPVCVLALVPFFPVDPLAAKVFTLQAAMPAMTQMAIVAKTYGADAAYAATLSLVTVLAGILVIPAYMVIVSLVI
ncbi:MAG: AEC family transporter [Acidaminococcaceae bacterium]|nr:AEC family transporter [Acidaminococcaceae bacterium]